MLCAFIAVYNFGRKHIRFYRYSAVSWRHYNRTFYDVPQLAHIAWKVEGAEQLQRLVCDSLGLDAELLGALLHEMAGEHEDVFTTLAQSGQPQADHVEAVKQVFAKDALSESILNGLIIFKTIEKVEYEYIRFS